MRFAQTITIHEATSRLARLLRFAAPGNKCPVALSLDDEDLLGVRKRQVLAEIWRLTGSRDAHNQEGRSIGDTDMKWDSRERYIEHALGLRA
jgi:hypothetical protein